MVLSYVLYKNAIVDLCYYFYFCINIKINLFLKSVFSIYRTTFLSVVESSFQSMLKEPFSNEGYLLNFII